jgi:hypothetical protein
VAEAPSLGSPVRVAIGFRVLPGLDSAEISADFQLTGFWVWGLGFGV